MQPLESAEAAARPRAVEEDTRSPAKTASALAVLRLSGELSTKARATRRRFLGQLVANLQEALAPRASTATGRARARARLPRAGRRAARVEIASRIFGVQSISLAERVAFASLDDLVEIAARRFADAVRERSFAVRARIVGGRETAEFGARDVEVALGTALLPGARRVDLGAPEVTVRVEVHRGAGAPLPRRDPGRGRPAARHARAARSRSSRAASTPRSPRGSSSGAACASTTCSATSAAARTSSARSAS